MYNERYLRGKVPRQLKYQLYYKHHASSPFIISSTMASQQTPNIPSNTQMYPQVSFNDKTTPPPPPSSSRQNLYPTLDMNDLVSDLFPPNYQNTLDRYPPSAPPADEDEIYQNTLEETLLVIPGSILHLIDRHYSVELAAGDFSVHRLRQDGADVAVVVNVGGEIQWPLTKDSAAVKLDESHYFFGFRAPGDGESDESLNYGLTIASKGQEGLLRELDGILVNYSNFSVHQVEENAAVALGGPVAREVSPEDLKSGKKKEVLEGRCAAYWTTLAPNVEEYSTKAGKCVASGSGKLIKGILWCGDVTADRLKWGNEVLINRCKAGSKAEVSPETLKRIKRVKRVTKMTEKVAGGVLSGAVKVSGFVTGSIANSKAGKKFFSKLPGELVLATLDGFSRIGDAVEVAGKNVMSTSNTATTEFVSHRYGEEAAKATSEGLNAAGHAFGTAWTVFKIKEALNPKSALKPTSLAKSAAKAAAKAATADKKSSK